MGNEAITLDGLALADGTTFALLSLQTPPPSQRQDWIGAADSEAQLLFRQPLHNNRTVTARIAIVPQASMDLALDKIGQVLDKLRKASSTADGIALTWTPGNSTRTVTFDALAGEITDMPIDWDSGWLSATPEIQIQFTCKPYWRGTEVLTSAVPAATPFVAMEIAGVTGDVPALGRLIITDAATQSRRHVEWGLEGPLTYNPATSLLIDSDDMVTAGFGGTQTTPAGAYDPNGTGTKAITVTPIAGATTAMCGTGNLSHVGIFRVKARVQTDSLSNSVRLSWKAGDGPTNHNDWVPLMTLTGWQELDLGTITIPAAVLGTQRWAGQIEVQLASGTSAYVMVDYLVLIPQADGYGKARASYSYSPGVLTGSDSFSGTTAGVALNARTAPLGGSWATSGDATDFAFADDLGGEQIKRSATASTTGRFGILGTTAYTDTEVSAKLAAASLTGTAASAGVVARYTDASNYLRAHISFFAGTNAATLTITQFIAGNPTASPIASFTFAPSTYVQIRLVVFATGRAIAQVLDGNGLQLAYTEMTTSQLAAGGTLQSGEAGIWDFCASGSGGTRYFDDVTVAVPSAEPIAIYSSRNMQVRYDDTLRQDSTGTYYGRPPSNRGSRFLVPPGTSRVLVKARRNDIETALDDQVLDNTTIQVGWTPRGIAVPRA